MVYADQVGRCRTLVTDSRSESAKSDLVDQDAQQRADGTNCTKVGSKELEAGQFQGEFLSNYFNKKGVDKVNYVMMQGTLGLGHTTDEPRRVRPPSTSTRPWVGRPSITA